MSFIADEPWPLIPMQSGLLIKWSDHDLDRTIFKWVNLKLSVSF